MADRFENTRRVAEQYAEDIINHISSPTEREHIKGFVIKFDTNFETVNIKFNFDVVSNSIEYGRGPGKYPPPQAIKIWIDKKGIVPESRNGNKAPTRDGLAFLISRKIAEEGTEGKHNLETAKEELNPIYKSLFEEAIAKDYENIITSENEDLFKK